MKTLSGFCCLALFLASQAATAANWRYIVYQGAAVSYDGPNPPVDLSYPPFGEMAPLIKVGDQPRGSLLTATQLAEELVKPHVVIIPPTARTQGGPARPAPSGPVMMQGGMIGY